MPFLKRYYIYFIVIAILAIVFFLFFFIKNPGIILLKEFLSFPGGPPQISLQDYVVDELLNDPFLSVLKDGSIIQGYKIKGSHKIDGGNFTVSVTLTSRQGPIQVSFLVSKLENRWLITEFPKTTYVDAAIPLSQEKIDNASHQYTVDVEGTFLNLILPLDEVGLEVGIPTSLVLIADYIAAYETMIPIRLKKIVSASENHIEDYALGYIPIESKLNIYDLVENQPVYQKADLLPIGLTDITLFRPPSPTNTTLTVLVDFSKRPKDKIRVALNNTQFSGLNHPEINISSPQGLDIENPVDNLHYNIADGDEVIFRYDDDQGILFYHQEKLVDSSHNRWYITPVNGNHVVVNNIKRAQSQDLTGTPYKGSFEISKGQDGIVLINEVDMEDYLYSVVPSEMPVKFGLESLKVQAIAARSYAARCLGSTGYAGFGAHVDDSTASQVYNNIGEYLIAMQAVDETRGLVPVFQGEIIDARFFSTSCGYTANFHETWSTDESFPGTEIPYLAAQPQSVGDAVSLNNEENFTAFIKEKEPRGYDQFSPYFRWTLTMKIQQIEALIKENLANLQRSQPDFVLTRGKDGSFFQQPIPDDPGRLQNITPITRGQGGNIMELEISTTSGIYKIIKELNIRQLLKPINLIPKEDPIEINRFDGSLVKDFPILPSAFFCLDIIRDTDGDISNVIFTGGGYGHGVGMSQYGTYGLSLMGKSYTEIIDHYYPGTELFNLY
ncbi:MAG: SpoIID/LytB domain-containing protein [Clostridiales bacterium]|nr:SpoIID/LytB domain-containing protein [Clostridiales bacterium]